MFSLVSILLSSNIIDEVIPVSMEIVKLYYTLFKMGNFKFQVSVTNTDNLMKIIK